ncbi:hypothetical protein [Metabacillus fastidiosus]|uniref:hypothetical protein n=1 Tax=Metabacillus fastidiosus TaxID=1458 RepID=UPI003D2BC8E4
MVDYKYEDVENIEVKQDFEVYKHDDDGEIIETVIIKKGIKGVIESMDCSSVNNFVVSYDICFTQDDNEIDVSISEGRVEELLILS